MGDDKPDLDAIIAAIRAEGYGYNDGDEQIENSADLEIIAQAALDAVGRRVRELEAALRKTANLGLISPQSEVDRAVGAARKALGEA